MRVDDFDFDLPADRIALRPARPRHAARLLVAESLIGQPVRLTDRHVHDLPDLLRTGDVLVFNDTKVIPAQLRAVRGPRVGERGSGELGGPVQIGGPKIDLTLIERLGPNVWRAFARPGKRLRTGDRLTIGGELGADVVEKEAGGALLLAFAEEGVALDAAIARLGAMPLPPYIASKRPADDQDREDYQTHFAAKEGAVAAPTAGLHFTGDLLERLVGRGVAFETLTLHVGAGTFLPVKAETTEDHVMHAEWGEVDAALAGRLEAARASGGRVIAVGTTVLRLLETAARETGSIRPFSGFTDIFITPGFRFRAVHGLLTNFHLPRSTLFMLVSAFMGLETMKAVYGHAIREDYRFYSYGDASLLLPGGQP